MIENVLFDIRTVNQKRAGQNNKVIDHTDGVQDHGNNAISVAKNVNSNNGRHKSKDFDKPSKDCDLKVKGSRQKGNFMYK